MITRRRPNSRFKFNYPCIFLSYLWTKKDVRKKNKKGDGG